jgi:hypothetical protein
MFENDSPGLSILILGTSTNHKVTNLENQESGSFGSRGMQFFVRNPQTDNAVFAGALS